MAYCGKRTGDALAIRRANLLNRCKTCSEVPGHCIIGPELTNVRAWNVVGPSIQVMEGWEGCAKDRRWGVAVFVWGMTLDLRYRVKYFRRFDPAMYEAMQRAAHLTGGPIVDWIDGDYMAGPVPGLRVPIMVNRR